MPEKKIEDLLKEKKIYQIINDKVVEASPADTLGSVIERMQFKRAGYCVLTENLYLKGIFTETDIATKVLGCDVDYEEPIRDWMTTDPTVMTPQDSVGDAIDLMAEKQVYHMPLLDHDKKLIGMLSARTLIRFLAEYYPNEVFNLPPKPGQISSTQEGG